jgi:uncharacterized protein YbjT (DUF2867 family)
MSTFLIIGGTGKVGHRLTQQLRDTGHTARVASRANGDILFHWTRPATYPAALHGVDGIFIIGPGSARDWSPALTELLAIARVEGVGHAVLLSARGVEFFPQGAVALAETALREGPLMWTILRPSHFAQNFTEAMFVPIDDTVTAPVAGGAEPFIDVADIAEVAAAVLTNPIEWDHDIIDLSGPQAHTFDDAAVILSTHAGRTIRFRDEDPDLHAQHLHEAGAPDGYIAWRMAMLDGIRHGRDAYISDGVQRVLGRPAASFADWATREATALTVTS